MFAVLPGVQRGPEFGFRALGLQGSRALLGLLGSRL